MDDWPETQILVGSDLSILSIEDVLFYKFITHYPLFLWLHLLVFPSIQGGFTPWEILWKLE